MGEQRTRLRFDAAGNMSSSFNAIGEIEVEVLPIDEVVQESGAPIYLKFDVEGAEWEALRGSERLLARARPLMAISVYHHPDDLWQLPSILQRRISIIAFTCAHRARMAPR